MCHYVAKPSAVFAYYPYFVKSRAVSAYYFYGCEIECSLYVLLLWLRNRIHSLTHYPIPSCNS